MATKSNTNIRQYVQHAAYVRPCDRTSVSDVATSPWIDDEGLTARQFEREWAKGINAAAHNAPCPCGCGVYYV